MIKEFLCLFPHATIRLTTNAYNKVSIYRARTEEFLWTIPHALNGRSKFGRTLMYMNPVTSLILASLFVLNNSA